MIICSVYLHAEEYDGVKISNLVNNWLQVNLEIHIEDGVVDYSPNILKLKKNKICPSDSELVFKVNDYNLKSLMSVNVSCPEHYNWYVNVPVVVTWLREVLVASKSIKKDELLGENNTKFIEKDILKLGLDYVTEFSDVDKLIAKRNIAPGDILKTSLLKKPLLFKKGDMITLIYSKNNLEIQTTVEALNNGHYGDTVKCKNIKSLKVVQATAIDYKLAIIN